MLATVTDKGQVTVPKEIRDRLNIVPGTKLEFRMAPDGTLTVRALRADPSRLRGMLKTSRARALTVEEMREAVVAHVAEKHARVRKSGTSAGMYERARRSASTKRPKQR